MLVELTIHEGDPLGGILIYTESEFSFRFNVGSPIDLLDRTGSEGMTSFSIGTLQIEVGVETGVLLFVWGLHPRSKWQIGTLENPITQSGVVRVSRTARLKRGVAIGIANIDGWSTVSDPKTGWIRVAGDDRLDMKQVLIATDVVIGIFDGLLNSIWLRPSIA
jgi:hypothetical protein